MDGLASAGMVAQPGDQATYPLTPAALSDWNWFYPNTLFRPGWEVVTHEDAVVQKALLFLQENEYFVDDNLFKFLRQASSAKVCCSNTEVLADVLGMSPSLFLY